MAAGFHKMHGLGNDFVVLDAREKDIVVTPGRARKLCDRKRGIGCDQLIRISNADAGAVRMEIWNPDGGPAEACGNAARCIAALTGASTIVTKGGALSASSDGDDIAVTLPAPRFDWDAIPLSDPMDTAPVPIGWGELEKPDAVNVGNPHLVFFVDDVDAVPLGDIGPEIETDAAFPDRINVNIVHAGPDGLHLRTFERGAGLTEACGTGACASAVAAIRRRVAASPVTVHMPGGKLVIAWAPGEPIVMKGPATHVFSGTVDLGALA